MNNYKDRDKKHLWHPLTQHGLNPDHLPLVRANGSYLYDEQGKAYIDGISSWYTCMYGHCNPQITSRVKHQLDQLDHIDLALIGMPSMVRKCHEYGYDAKLVYHAFDHLIYDKLRAAGYTDNGYLCDFSYVGSSGFGHNAHAQRYWDLLTLAERTNIRFWIDELKSLQEKNSRLFKNIGYIVTYYLNPN